MSQPDLENFSEIVTRKVNSCLEDIFSAENARPGERIFQAMRYATLIGGKRVRPLLCFASAQLFDDYVLDNQAVLASACSLEMIHAYSLIHDDLPAMDDDDLRRGKATTHIQFDEATAILAGDALQALAFETLAKARNISAVQNLTLIKLLAQASGAAGMVGGQMIDLQAVGQNPNLEELMQMHALKTGALICASVLMGASAAGCEDKNQLSDLRNYAEAIGLAFQIKDDILDHTADTATLGKQQGADADKDKPNYVSLLGLEDARVKLFDARQRALGSLDRFNNSALLIQLADYIVDRTH